MPYTRFAGEAARDPPRPRTPVDPVRRLESSRSRNRLSTLQRPRRQGHPLFLRPRRSGGHGHETSLRHAAAIPPVSVAPARLWNVHQAFETPTRFLRQLAETPDGVRYVILARDVSKTGGAWGTPPHGASPSRWAAR